jgi:N-acetyl-gamma-glutamyl-phosphate reductase
MIKVGIIGGAGYTAGELLRILINHPEVEISFVNSQSNAGNPISSVHSGLIGDTDLTFTDALPLDTVDVLFFCTAHGDSVKFMEAHGAEIPASTRIIDLSQDYRLRGEHDFVYGLAELQRDAICGARHVANPGCFATCIQLALLPAFHAGWVSGDVHINGITGSTGAGVKPSATTHYSWRNDNISIYKTFKHQHLLEIGETCHKLEPQFDGRLLFVPQRGCFARGIFVTAYTTCDRSLEEVKQCYADYYRDARFTHVVESSPDMKQVIGTNKALVYVDKYEDQLLAVACIDNLLKGASGQAVQNMNLMFGLPEDTGLRLKPVGF